MEVDHGVEYGFFNSAHKEVVLPVFHRVSVGPSKERYNVVNETGECCVGALNVTPQVTYSSLVAIVAGTYSPRVPLKLD